MDTFVMPDGRKISIDFKNFESLKKINKKDWKEIGKQLKEWLQICCSKMTGEEVYNLLRP